MQDRPLKQKTIGLLGGCSNIATGEYYRFLNTAVNEKLGGWEIAETLIAGMNFGNIEAFIRNDDWDGLSDYMQVKIDSLVAGGADVILCVSNTLHKPLEDLMSTAPIPFIHIADPTGEAIQAQGLSKVAIFGTRPVMQMGYLKERFLSRFGVEAIAPTEKEQDDIDRIIFNELVKGKLTKESKSRYIEIAERMRQDDGAQGLILGCTEIFLLIDQQDLLKLPMFNTAKLHCDAAVVFSLNQ